jgi:hypothetical protein
MGNSAPAWIRLLQCCVDLRSLGMFLGRRGFVEGCGRQRVSQLASGGP